MKSNPRWDNSLGFHQLHSALMRSYPGQNTELNTKISKIKRETDFTVQQQGSRWDWCECLQKRNELNIRTQLNKNEIKTKFSLWMLFNGMIILYRIYPKWKWYSSDFFSKRDSIKWHLFMYMKILGLIQSIFILWNKMVILK